MKNAKLIFLIIYTSLYICLPIKAQEVAFQHLTTDDGLSHNSITSIYQDERDFMWFGTRNGLNLYNGKIFKIYKKEKNEPNSVLYNDIYHITGDKKGHIFIMTNRGVSSYNIAKDSFKTVIQQNIKAMYFAKRLYFATSKQIFTFDKGKISTFYEIPKNLNCTITRLHVWKDSVFIGTNKGVYRLTPHKKLQQLIHEGYTSDILRCHDGTYWITMSSGHGVYHIHNDDRIENFRHNLQNPNSLSSDFTHRCCEDSVGNIWIGTFNGLNRYDPQSGKFIRYLKYENSKSLSQPSVWGLYCDKQGTIWAGTYSGGINYFNIQQQLYKEYHDSPKESEGLSSPIVGRMIEDEEGHLWICTERGGLNRYDPNTQTYQWYKTNNGDDNVRAIYYDAKRKTMWLGIHLKGLYRLNLQNGKFTQYKREAGNPTSLPSNQVEDIIPYQDKLLLATSNGITLFDPHTGVCKQFFHNQELLRNTVSTFGLFFDHEGTLWTINNNNGVCAYHVNSGNYSIYKHRGNEPNSLSSNSVNSAYEDSQHRLWFCTNENGLDLYRKKTDDFENFDMRKNGLASNVVYNICELSPNKLLVTTDKGFSILDYQQKKFENYDQLPLSCISENALYRNRNGEIFIGGNTGLISFMPERLKPAPRSYRIYPYSLTVNGKELKVGDKSGILKQNLTNTSSITLQADQNVFHIEYATTDYIPYNKNHIIYQLEGFSKQWNELGPNDITYTNLNPGTYTLVVKAQGADEHSVPPSKLEIKILPPIYQTPVAYFLYTVCILFILYYLIHTYYRRLKLQESLKYEKKHAMDIENLNQAKLRFFTNISHEFRTPLTLIIGQLEMLLQMRSFPANVYKKILGTYNNSLQLRELITELLDFRKQEQGYATIKVQEHNIVDFIYEHYLSFYEYAKQREITFQFKKSNDDIRTWYDAKQMQKVMNNLISNAFKHTPKGGTISIVVKKEYQEVLIEVIDNGTGIAAKDINKIFERFYQTDEHSLFNVGSGIGLALTKSIIEAHHGEIKVYSEINKGSTFCIHLKLGNSHFSAEQICETEDKENNKSLCKDLMQPLCIEQQITEEEIEPADGEKHKILIVEDNEALKQMLTNIFKPFYIVTTAANGAEGLDKVHSEQPDIILSDILMPQMSGLELCHIIKKDIDTCHIPVVLLTAQATTEHNLNGLHAGADDYITKPFNVSNLLLRCKNLINNRTILQEKFSKQPNNQPQILTINDIDQKFIDKVMEIINNKMEDNEFTVDILASMMGISRTKFFQRLKDVTGQTPGELIMDVRLKKAAFLLKNHPEMSISEVADSTGFSMPKYFSKCFKKKYHLSPKAYQNEAVS